MSCILGLSIGESFAELIGVSELEPAKAFLQSRWYLPRKSIPDGLAEAIKNHQKDLKGGGTLRVATDSLSRILEKNQGRAPAVVVTAGFETWLASRQPFISAPFAIRAKRRSLPTDSELVFGLNERIKSTGEVQVKLNVEDLEFLAAKFELMKVKDVALCLLNSTVNSEHELMAASFLREKGFRVFLSHRVTEPQNLGTNQENRWRQTVENAFAESALLEEKEQIELAGKTLPGDWKLEVWTPDGPKTFREYTSSMTRESLATALANHAATEKGLTLHCGLDGFRIFGGANMDLQTKLKLQPTARICHGVWQFPSISQEFSGYAPGPMAFGRSQTLVVLDVLYVRERLKDIEALSALLNEKSRARILESLFTLAKLPSTSEQQHKRPPDASEIARDLERAFVERCAISLAASGVEKNVRICGALAKSMLPLLKARRPDLRFKYDDELQFFESQAASGTSVPGAKS